MLFDLASLTLPFICFGLYSALPLQIVQAKPISPSPSPSLSLSLSLSLSQSLSLSLSLSLTLIRRARRAPRRGARVDGALPPLSARAAAIICCGDAHAGGARSISILWLYSAYCGY